MSSTSHQQQFKPSPTPQANSAVFATPKAKTTPKLSIARTLEGALSDAGNSGDASTKERKHRAGKLPWTRAPPSLAAASGEHSGPRCENCDNKTRDKTYKCQQRRSLAVRP
eukprot:592879-Amphidinium_carterae.1